MYSKRVSFCNSPSFKLLTLASIPSSSLCKYRTHLCSIRPERLHSLSDTRRWMASRNPQRCLRAAVLSISLSAPQTQNSIRSQTRRRCEVFLKKSTRRHLRADNHVCSVVQKVLRSLLTSSFVSSRRTPALPVIPVLLLVLCPFHLSPANENETMSAFSQRQEGDGELRN